MASSAWALKHSQAGSLLSPHHPAAAHHGRHGEAVMLCLVRRIGDGPPNLLEAMSTMFTTHKLSSPCPPVPVWGHACLLSYGAQHHAFFQAEACSHAAEHHHAGCHIHNFVTDGCMHRASGLHQLYSVLVPELLSPLCMLVHLLLSYLCCLRLPPCSAATAGICLSRRSHTSNHHTGGICTQHHESMDGTSTAAVLPLMQLALYASAPAKHERLPQQPQLLLV